MYSPFTAQWLAAMEKSRDVPAGVYQMQYSTALNDSMQDSLLEDPLAAAVVTVADNNSDGGWVGHTDRAVVRKGTLYSRDWPQAASALSKCLKSLQATLQMLNIYSTLTTGSQPRSLNTGYSDAMYPGWLHEGCCLWWPQASMAAVTT